LSNWFKTYFYNPLLMLLLRRKTSRASEPFLAVFAFFLTFFLLGVWHGRTSQFVIYGLLLGFGVSVNKLYQIFIVRTFGRKRYKALCDQPAYSAIARGLTYTYFSFSLLWFWSTWKQLAGFTWQLRPAGCVAVWALTFVTATVVLTFWEALRAWLLSFSIQGQPILQTRYARTVFATAAMVMTAVAMSLLMGPPPEIVYRSF
jgi:alginate O-acetyltransferase complex protein AlgI